MPDVGGLLSTSAASCSGGVGGAFVVVDDAVGDAVPVVVVDAEVFSDTVSRTSTAPFSGDPRSSRWVAVSAERCMDPLCLVTTTAVEPRLRREAGRREYMMAGRTAAMRDLDDSVGAAMVMMFVCV